MLALWPLTGAGFLLTTLALGLTAVALSCLTARAERPTAGA
ncbi:hypothetical protein ACLGI4_01695 [Streptomyces sp. HMX112]